MHLADTLKVVESHRHLRVLDFSCITSGLAIYFCLSFSGGPYSTPDLQRLLAPVGAVSQRGTGGPGPDFGDASCNLTKIRSFSPRPCASICQVYSGHGNPPCPSSSSHTEIMAHRSLVALLPRQCYSAVERHSGVALSLQFSPRLCRSLSMLQTHRHFLSKHMIPKSWEFRLH